jgi:hypothetical protein
MSRTYFVLTAGTKRSILGVVRQGYLLRSHKNSVISVQHWLLAMGIHGCHLRWVSGRVNFSIDIVWLTSNRTLSH